MGWPCPSGARGCAPTGVRACRSPATGHGGVCRAWPPTPAAGASDANQTGSNPPADPHPTLKSGATPAVKEYIVSSIPDTSLKICENVSEWCKGRAEPLRGYGLAPLGLNVPDADQPPTQTRHGRGFASGSPIQTRVGSTTQNFRRSGNAPTRTPHRWIFRGEVKAMPKNFEALPNSALTKPTGG